MKERLKEYSDRELLEGIIEYNTPTNRNLFDGMIKVLRNISKVKKITICVIVILIINLIINLMQMIYLLLLMDKCI